VKGLDERILYGMLRACGEEGVGCGIACVRTAYWGSGEEEELDSVSQFSGRRCLLHARAVSNAPEFGIRGFEKQVVLPLYVLYIRCITSNAGGMA
jgi:hypothetical protein